MENRVQHPGWKNFEGIYKSLVDVWMLYDNSGEKPLLIDAGGKKMKTAKEIVLKKDVAKVSAALRRAAKQARKKAVQTRTPLVIYEDGRVKRKMVVGG